MPRRIIPLNDFQIRKLKTPTKEIKLFDGNGLFLLATPSGGKLWRLKYRFYGKEKLLSFGAYPEISLLAARQKRKDARQLIAQGIDPSEAQKSAALTGETFQQLALDWLLIRKLTTRHRPGKLDQRVREETGNFVWQHI